MKLAVVAVPLLLIASGCARQDEDTSATAPSDMTTTTPAVTTDATTPSTAAPVTLATFVERMAMSDMFEIESSKLAQQKAQSPEVKQFARQMVTDHTATSTRLKSLLAADSTAPKAPTALDQEHQDRLARLRSASAQEFDGIYLDQQTEAHENAIELLRSYAQNGDNPQVKAFAAETATKVEQHLTMVRDLDRAGADDMKKS